MTHSLRVAFTDFWPGFDPSENFFTRLLSDRFELELSDRPDLLIHSCYGGPSPAYRSFDCLRLFVSWENRGWGFSNTDLAITCDVLAHRDHYRFPFYAVGLTHPFEQPTIDADRVFADKTGFAAVVVSNPAGVTRNRVHDLLDEYKVAASGGKFRNNIGGPVQDKMGFLAQHKFCIAFENSSRPGYVTEKIVDALRADTVPIYWGDPDIASEFNPERFVNYHAFKSEAELVRRVIELDQDDDAYRAMLRAPWFIGGQPPECTRHDLLLDWLETRIADGRTPIAQRRSPLLLARHIADRAKMRRRYRSKVF